MMWGKNVQITAEQLYNEYHRQTFHAKRGIYPRAVVNFDKCRSKEWWVSFQKAAEFISSNPNIDHVILVRAIATAYRERFDPRLLMHPRGFKLYRAYIEERNAVVDDSSVMEVLKESFRNAVDACRINGISTFEQYLNFNSSIIPLMAIQYGNGQISSMFLALIPNMEHVLKNYPKDIVDEYFAGFRKSYGELRQKVRMSEKLRKISDNMHVLFEKMI